MFSLCLYNNIFLELVNPTSYIFLSILITEQLKLEFFRKEEGRLSGARCGWAYDYHRLYILFERKEIIFIFEKHYRFAEYFPGKIAMFWRIED